MSLAQRAPLAVLFGLCLVLACVGCSGDKGNRVSGTISFKGKPVPNGKIYFTPAGKEAKGQQGFADIKDGKYDTSAKGGQGAPSGQVIVIIEGFDGETPLFAGYEEVIDLPSSSSTKDFTVPDRAADRLPKPSGPPV